MTLNQERRPRQGLWWRNTERSRDQKETSKAVSSGLLGTNVKEKSQLDPSGEDGFERAESHRWGSSVLPAEGVHMETFLSLKNISAFAQVVRPLSLPVLVSSRCCNKLSQTGCLDNRNSFLTVLEAESPRSRCWLIWFLGSGGGGAGRGEGGGENIFSFILLSADISSSSYKGTCPIRLGLHPCDLI